MDEDDLNLEAILASDQVTTDSRTNVPRAPTTSRITPLIQGRARHISLPFHHVQSTPSIEFDMNEGIKIKAEIEEDVYSFPSPTRYTTIDSVPSEHSDKPTVFEDVIEHSIVDDDDDILIIDPANASSAARRKWAQPGGMFQRIVTNANGPAVKQEPSSPESRVKESLPFLASNRNYDGQPKKNTVVDLLNRNRELLKKRLMAAHENTARSKRQRRHLEIDGGHVSDDLDEIDDALKDPSDEDHSWMEAEPEQDDAYDQKKQLRDDLQVRRNNGKITSAELAMFFKLQKQLNEIDKLRALAAQAQTLEQFEEEPLFVPLDRPNQRRRRSLHQRFTTSSTSLEKERKDYISNESLQGTRSSQELDQDDLTFATMLEQALAGDGVDTFPTTKELASGSKPRRKRAKNAREVREQEREKELKKAGKQREKDRAKAQRKKAQGDKPSTAQGRRKKGPAGKGKSTVKSKSMAKEDTYVNFNGYGQQSGNDTIAQRILDDLKENDPITDRVRNPIFETSAEPRMEGRNKQTQLQCLFASIPEGSSENTARSDKKKLQEASRSFGYAKVKAVDGKWLVAGMKSTLYHHQLLGAQWMVSRELSDTAPYGGLLADSMGLGKTVQALACMVGNKPSPDDLKRNVNATLIIVPSSVIGQWMSEIRVHAEEKMFPKILHYRTKSGILPPVLQSCDIIITSYNEVMRQFPYPDAEAKKEIAQIGYKRWWKTAKKQIGVLHRVSCEAHAIKNNASRTSLACQNLKSIFRWCLTGTPILNRLEELFPYLRFLKADYSMDWKTFQNYFCDPEADDCHARIATLLSYTMIRRTMSTTILNRPLIHLPTPHPFIQYVDFSVEERIIYRITENRFRSNLNLFLKNKSKCNPNKYQSSYGVFLVQLLRLRQCTSHPFMLEYTIKEAWTSADLNELKKKFSQLKTNTQPFYEQCKVWVNQSVQARNLIAASGTDPAIVENGAANNDVITNIFADQEAGVPMRFGSSTYGHTFDMQKAFKSLNEKDLWSRETCRLCTDVPSRARITDCGHIFCYDCINTYMHSQAASDAQYEDDTFICPACDKMFDNLRPYNGAYGLNDEDDEGSPDVPASGGESSRQSSVRDTSRSQSKSKTGKNSHSKGRDAMGFEPSTKDSTWVNRSDIDPGFPLVPSAKTTALKSVLLKGFAEAPADKVVIFVQFRTLAKIVGRICASENWGFLYMTGDTSLDHRDRVVNMFRTNPEIKILIAGLKCGGVGLNFPWANRCISLDLWYNHSIEQQAFGRIFRIGQKKETYMTRIAVRNSVDMRLLSMQMWKLKTCERAMQDGDKKDQAVLNLADLARLFGFLRTNEDGEPIEVVADYNDEPESHDNGEGSSSGANIFSDQNHNSPSIFSGDEIEEVEGGYMNDLK